MKIKVMKVPAAGASTQSEVEVEATGASVKEVLKAAGVDSSKMKVTIGGNTVTDDTHVDAGATVTLTEKPKGS